MERKEKFIVTFSLQPEEEGLPAAEISLLHSPIVLELPLGPRGGAVSAKELKTKKGEARSCF